MKKFLLIISILSIFSCDKTKSNACDSNDVKQDLSKENRKVLIVGVDGFRSDAIQSNISPFLFSLSQNSNTYFTPKTKTEKTTSSGPNWSSILTGVHQEKHLVLNNGFSANDLENYPHFMSFIEKAKPEFYTISLTHWSPINIFVTKEIADYAPVEETEDSLVVKEANSFLKITSSSIPDVMFLHLDDLDHAGHSKGFHPDTTYYSETIERLDNYIELLYNSIENRRSLGEDWMFFVVSDHGGHLTDHTSYPDNPDVHNTIFFANHPTLKFDSNIENEQVNLVPTILDYMGIQSERFDCYTDGKSLLKN